MTISTIKLQYFRLGIDWIRFNFDKEFDTKIFDQLFTNFPAKGVATFPYFGKEFSLAPNSTKQRLFLYFDYGKDRVFCLEKILDMGIARNIPYAFTFYGEYFYVPELQDILEHFLLRYGPHLSTSRLDLALDINIPVPTLYKRHRTHFRHKIPYIYCEEEESFYLGLKANCKKHFIRVYNKKLEIQKHPMKWHLLPECLTEEIYTRIEVELHTKTLKDMNITPQAILAFEQAHKKDFAETENILEVWFRSLCINEDSTCFSPLAKIDFRSDRKIITAKYTGRSEEIDMLRYPRMMLGYAKRLNEAGFDVRSYINDFLPPNDAGLNQHDSPDPLL